MTNHPVFALDQDFPLTLAAPQYWPGVDLRPLGSLYPDLVQNHEDWEVIRELRLRKLVAGFVTLDRGMLTMAKEMTILHQSKLTLVVVEEGGSDPLVATGLLMVYMPQILSAYRPDVAQLWRLSQRDKRPMDPWEQLSQIAAHQNVNVGQLYDENRLPHNVLR